MLDIHFVRENAKLVEKKAQQKGYKINIKHLLQLDDDRRKLLNEIEAVRAERNQLAQQLQDKKPSEAALVKGQGLRARLKKLELELDIFILPSLNFLSKYIFQYLRYLR